MQNIIKILRQEKGLTQEELGEYLGVKKSAIQKYESGAIVNLKVATIRKLCDLFEVAPSTFIYEKHTPLDLKVIDNPLYIEVMKNACNLNDLGLVKVNEYIKDLLRIEVYIDNDEK
jgi:transcriptional regulator with XRE-family HTH domain